MKIKTSPYTELFWNEYQLNPKRNDYNIVFDQTIFGNLDLAKLSKSLTKLVNDFALLNSHLIKINNDLYWEKNVTISPLIPSESQQTQGAFVEAPFNLETGPLYRFGVFKISKNKYDLIIVLHHAIIDGASVNEFLALISSYYNSNIKPVISINKQIDKIKDINKSLDDKVNSIKKSKAHNFWHEALINSHSKNHIPIFKSEEKGIREFRFNIIKNKIDFSIIKNLKTTSFIFLANIFGFMMSRYCNQKVVHISYPCAIKEASSFIFGSNINPIILPITISPNLTFKNLIEKSNLHIKNYKLDREHKYNYLPIRDILSSSNISTLNVAFAQTNLKDEKLCFDGCSAIVNKRYNIDIASSELVFEYEENAKEIACRIKYDQSIFNENYIKQITNEFNSLLELFLNTQNINKELSGISILTQHEYQKIIIDWNQTDKNYPRDKTIYQLFQEQATSTPNDIALVYDGQTLTYSELNQKSNQLARYIQTRHNIKASNQIPTKNRKTLQSNTLIALCLDKSLEMIIGILSIMKSGSAYVPIDPEYPEDRINYILEDTQTKLVLTQSHLTDNLKNITNQNKVDLIELDSDCYQMQEITNLEANNKSTDLVYVIYTSGTTGNPKGVMIQHKSVCNYAKNISPYFKHIKNIDYSSNLSFDLSITTSLIPLLFGKTIHIYNGSLSNIDKYLNHLNDNKIDFIKATPSFLTQVKFKKISHKIDSCFLGGEKVNQNQIEYLNQYINNVFDEYGPTEATVGSTNILNTDGINSIGKVYNNYQAYVLDQNNQPVPIGVTGELHIGGAGLAKGYLNKPELTQEKFIPNPFENHSKIEKGYTKLYKTGDLVRWLPNGNLEYIGRNDNQVKIRGYRIELEAIENMLCSSGMVSNAVVIAEKKAYGSILVTYVVPTSLNKFDTYKLLKSLAQKYPAYWIPSKVILVERLPLNHNGKINKNKLTELNILISPQNSLTKPSTKCEQKITTIWTEILKYNPNEISTQSEFYHIGGSSLLLMPLLSKLQKTFNCQLTLQDLIINNSIKKQANLIEQYNQTTTLKWRCYRKIENTIPIILLPPRGAGLESYSKFHKLFKNTSVYGIESHNMFCDKGKYIKSLTSLAKYNNKILKKYLPQGPYKLMGWSFGGSIAQEMARQLEMSGESVAGVYMLDSMLLDKKNAKYVMQVEPIIERILINSELFLTLDTDSQQRLLKVKEIENKMAINHQYQSCTSPCWLFKAKEHAYPLNYTQNEKYLMDEYYQNIDKYTSNGWDAILDNLKVIMIQATHKNIISCDEINRIIRITTG